ncbi:alcohol dehydrogenase class IV [Tepidamorphus gemmatus]|jgi:4-hydroxybutyrate dehydrogenase|uniref:Alcohol dehydrogenase class IV n=1 Tax=Tepidamorphus gemmatus TaxID=747076 RepID=A0A4V2UZ54_9HYPH|nr:iron-containing alcohol dehydrogenase [Tepidamorphus gemmatus]TCT09918.1 alcohol dehydrogenase class IV [Tepidamorphus gemmatus]
MSLITYLTRIHFADRVLEDALPEEIDRLKLDRLLVVHDAEAGAGEALDRVLYVLPPHCEASVVAADTLGSGGSATQDRVDGSGRAGVLGLGGSRALGLARQTAEALGEAVPILAVPTTTACVGIASMTPGSSGAAGTRRTARLPSVVLCDPTLTLHAGPAATAAAGMDALVHCIETYLATAWNPPADGIALEGVRRAAAWLQRAVDDGRDIEARREILAVALNGALAGQKGLGGVHALAHAIEAELAARGDPPGRVPAHGALHAALLPPVLAFNAPAVGDRYQSLAEAMRLPPGTDLGEALARMGARIGLPNRLAALGLDAAIMDRIAGLAAEDVANHTNPRHATTADYRVLLQEAL